MNVRRYGKQVLVAGIAACMLLNASFAIAQQEAKESEQRSPVILTPHPSPKPRINSPGVFGVRPGSPFLYTIAATGERPMEFSAANLPQGLSLDKTSGQITGVLKTKGKYTVMLSARNSLGTAEKPLEIIVGDKIALTPPMGWNSWNCWAGAVDQDKVLRAAKALKEKGLADHGWSYINIDDTWQGKRGGEFNAIQGNEKFPDIKGLSDQIHKLGLKIGVYSSPWNQTFAGHIGCTSDDPTGNSIGERGHYSFGKYSFIKNDARQWAAWGIDYLKYDWYPNDAKHVREMEKALRNSGRDIVFSLSCAAPFNQASYWSQHANCWRTTPDITDTWDSVRDIGFYQDRWWSYAGPGHWNDPDMLVVGQVGWGGNQHVTRLTPDEQYSHMTLWCLLSAPLLLGCNVEQMDDFTLGLLTNDEVLEVDQDTLGQQAVTITADGPTRVVAKTMEDGSRAVGMFNLGDSPHKVKLWLTYIQMEGPHQIRDLWRQKDLGTFKDLFETEVPSHGVVMVKVRP